MPFPQQTQIRTLRDYFTIIVPFICAWIEQRYSYLPGSLNVNENLSPVSSPFDLNVLPSTLTTVCTSSSLLVHVTCVPAGIVNSFGTNVKLSMFTSFAAAFSCCAVAGVEALPTARPASVSEIARANTAPTDRIAQATRVRFVLQRFMPISLALQSGIHNCQRVFPANKVYIRDPQQPIQLFRRHFHRSR